MEGGRGDGRGAWAPGARGVIGRGEYVSRSTAGGSRIFWRGSTSSTFGSSSRDTVGGPIDFSCGAADGGFSVVVNSLRVFRMRKSKRVIPCGATGADECLTFLDDIFNSSFSPCSPAACISIRDFAANFRDPHKALSTFESHYTHCAGCDGTHRARHARGKVLHGTAHRHTRRNTVSQSNSQSTKITYTDTVINVHCH